MAFKLKVLVSLNIPEIGIEMLQNEGFEVTVWRKEEPMSQSELIEKTKQHDILLSTGAYKLDADFFKECNHLNVVSQFAAGYDNIDISAAKMWGVPVGNTPNAMNNATADIAFGLMLAVARNMIQMNQRIRDNRWGSFKPRANLGQELKGKTLGIFGLGRIGYELALRCKGAYSMNIIYHNRSANLRAEKELGAQYRSFEELLAESDVISVHAALTDETRETFDAAAFKQMKTTAIFINTSRGGLHNEKDLTKALQDNVIWGAGLDVTNPEPMKADNLLLSMDRVAITPHVGSATVIARNEMSRMAAENIIEFVKGNELPNRVV